MITKLTGVIQAEISALPRLPEALEEKLRDVYTEGISQMKQQYMLMQVKAVQDLISSASVVSDAPPAVMIAREYATKLRGSEAEVLNSLQYSVMQDREDDISPAELATFDWIFEDSDNQDRPWSNFLEWLQSDSNVYVIRCQAGSGKSTQIKHSSPHPKTLKALSSWKGDVELVIGSFFFWYSGSELQRSQTGLLRALLYDCLKHHRELLFEILPDTKRLRGEQLLQHWTPARIRAAFASLIRHALPFKIVSS